MRTPAILAIIFSLMSVPVIVLLASDSWLVWKFERAVKSHADVEALGEPIERIDRDFKCARTWTCDACVKFEADGAAGDRVLIFTSHWRMFYVRVGADDRVMSWAACGS